MYKLINLETKQEFICEKIEIDGYEYYAYSEKSAFVKGAMFITIDNIIHSNYGYNYLDRVIIASNNPAIDIPQVVDEVEGLSNKANGYLVYAKNTKAQIFNDGYIVGYNKAKEQYLYSKQDMINFAKFWALNKDYYRNKIDMLILDILEGKEGKLTICLNEYQPKGENLPF